MLNYEQVTGLLRILLGAGGPIGAWLISRGLSQDQVNGFAQAMVAVMTAAPPLVALIWSFFAHTTDAKLKSVESLPEVAKIELHPVDATAKAAIDDTTRPKVVAAPNTPPAAPQPPPPKV